MPIYKRCSRCGSRIESGASCTCHKERHKAYDRYERDAKSKQFYDSAEWLAARDRALMLDSMDVYVYMTEGKIIAPDTVHHIIPLRDDWSRRTDISNLMSLSHETHSRIEREYRKDKKRMIKELQPMLQKFRAMAEGGAV